MYDIAYPQIPFHAGAHSLGKGLPVVFRKIGRLTAEHSVDEISHGYLRIIFHQTGGQIKIVLFYQSIFYLFYHVAFARAFGFALHGGFYRLFKFFDIVKTHIFRESVVKFGFYFLFYLFYLYGKIDCIFVDFSVKSSALALFGAFNRVGQAGYRLRGGHINKFPVAGILSLGFAVFAAAVFYHDIAAVAYSRAFAFGFQAGVMFQYFVQMFVNVFFADGLGFLGYLYTLISLYFEFGRDVDAHLKGKRFILRQRSEIRLCYRRRHYSLKSALLQSLGRSVPDDQIRRAFHNMGGKIFLYYIQRYFAGPKTLHLGFCLDLQQCVVKTFVYQTGLRRNFQIYSTTFF